MIVNDISKVNLIDKFGNSISKKKISMTIRILTK